ncbi:hypothetical protein VPH35_072232 [Triticum aestivum]
MLFKKGLFTSKQTTLMQYGFVNNLSATLSVITFLKLATWCSFYWPIFILIAFGSSLVPTDFLSSTSAYLHMSLMLLPFPGEARLHIFLPLQQYFFYYVVK